MGSISGPVIASAILTAIPEVLRAVARWRLVIYGLLMVVVMLFRPEGLLGNRELSLYPLIKKYKEKRLAPKRGNGKMALLQVENLSVQFGGLKALNDVSLQVDTGDFVGLIGPNGAGKTTLFNAITGVVHASAGTIVFDGKSIKGCGRIKSRCAGSAGLSRISAFFPK